MEAFGLFVTTGVLLVMLILGVPVVFSILTASITAFLVFLPPEQISVIGSVMWGSIGKSVLAAVPLFILMGELFSRSGLSDRAYDGMSGALDRLPGGMIHTNIAACSVFAAASGSSVGTTAAIGRTAMPQLNSRNYPRELSYGSLVAGGTLGILIPPSLAFIVFGVLTGTSIGDLFVAGIIPGLFLSGSFVALVFLLALTLYRDRMPAVVKTPAVVALKNLIGVVPLIMVIVVVVASMYFGIATTTEAGAVGAMAMLLLGLKGVIKDRSVLVESLRSTVTLTGMILTILMSSALLSYVVTVSGIGRDLQRAAENFAGSTLILIFLLFLVMLVMGMFLDPTSVLALLLPIVFPISQALEIEPLWLAVFMVVNLELGLITPPIGLNLFVLKSVDPTATWSQLFRGPIPFVGVMVLFLGLLILIPGLATWLPGQMGG